MRAIRRPFRSAIHELTSSQLASWELWRKAAIVSSLRHEFCVCKAVMASSLERSSRHAFHMHALRSPRGGCECGTNSVMDVRIALETCCRIVWKEAEQEPLLPKRMQLPACLASSPALIPSLHKLRIPCLLQHAIPSLLPAQLASHCLRMDDTAKIADLELQIASLQQQLQAVRSPFLPLFSLPSSGKSSLTTTQATAENIRLKAALVLHPNPHPRHHHNSALTDQLSKVRPLPSAQDFLLL